MVQAAVYGAAQGASMRMAGAPPPRTRRKKMVAASIVVAVVCMCAAVLTFGFSGSAAESEALLSKCVEFDASSNLRCFMQPMARLVPCDVRNVASRYAVKKAAPHPLGKVELAVLKIKTRANDKVTNSNVPLLHVCRST
jgi:hypothetical protein